MTATYMDGARPGDPGESALLLESLPAASASLADEGWATRLVTVDREVPALALARRVLAGLALSALYGLAIGARQGGRSLIEHGLGVPLGLLLVVLVGAPSVFVFLSLCKAPVDARELGAVAASGIGNAGLLLAGLAPAALLFVVSSETPHAASGAVIVGLCLGGGIALGRVVWGILGRATRQFTAASLLGSLAVSAGFAAFAILFAMRMWSALLPVLGGGS